MAKWKAQAPSPALVLRTSNQPVEACHAGPGIQIYPLLSYLFVFSDVDLLHNTRFAWAETLPWHVLQRILELLNDPSDYGRACSVCKRWRRIGTSIRHFFQPLSPRSSSAAGNAAHVSKTFMFVLPPSIDTYIRFVLRLPGPFVFVFADMIVVSTTRSISPSLSLCRNR